MSIQLISELFDQAVELEDTGSRDRFIEEHCADSPEQAAKLRRMVQAHAEQHRLLDNPTQVIVFAAESSGQDNQPREGSVIGCYKLLEQIGEGGMGLVYMAEQQQPIRRRVAMKIIKADLSSSQVLARFEAEREALSRLDHPNITRILDAGATVGGRPYFVMELVRGTSLTEYCDQQQASIEERLELMEQTCRAVHHAHQKGVIHRDLKPSNVMVTLHDGQPVPKVIDFGIAKALDRPLTEKTLFTRYGDMIGTPQYMSPEQAEMSGLDLDVHTDIYSLGVLLYELLTGSTPIEADTLKSKGLLGVFQTIRDCDAETPSVRVTRTLTRDEQIAYRRKTTCKLLQRSIVGELDWITLKALAKKRTDRYESAAAMARDIRAYLHGEPVDAAAPSFWYQTSKFFRRHKAICLIALASITCLLSLTTLSGYWAIANSRLRTLAQQKSDELGEKSDTLEQVNEELRQALRRASIAEAEATRLADRERRDAAIGRALGRFAFEQIQAKFQQGAAQLVAPAAGQGPTPVAVSAVDDGIMIEISKTADLAFGANVSVSLGVENEPADQVPSVVQVAEQLDYASALLLHLRVILASHVGGDGEMLFDQILEELRKEFSNEHVVVADHLLIYGRYLLEEGGAERFLKAENEVRDALAILNKQAPESVSRFEGQVLLAKSLMLQDRLFQAEGALQEIDASAYASVETDLADEEQRRLKSALAEVESLRTQITRKGGAQKTPEP